MYHIKSDRRSQRTAAEIGRGLLECLKEKPLSSVTVTDIHRITSISRATFYRLFDNIEDVLDYLCEESSREDLEQLGAIEADSTDPLFTRLLAKGMESHDLFKALMDNGRYDLLFRYADRRYRLMQGLSPARIQELDEDSYDYVISAMAMNMVATMVTWHRRGRIDSAEEIARYTAEYLKIMTGFVENGKLEPAL